MQLIDLFDRGPPRGVLIKREIRETFWQGQDRRV